MAPVVGVTVLKVGCFTRKRFISDAANIRGKNAKDEAMES